MSEHRYLDQPGFLNRVMDKNDNGMRCFKFYERCELCKHWRPLPDSSISIAKKGECRFNAPNGGDFWSTRWEEVCGKFSADLALIAVMATEQLARMEWDFKHYLVHGHCYLDDPSEEEKERRRVRWIETQEYGNSASDYWPKVSDAYVPEVET